MNSVALKTQLRGRPLIIWRRGDEGNWKKKMQLDVDIEPTFRFSYMKCLDKQKDITMKQLYFRRYGLFSSETDRQKTMQYAQVGSYIERPLQGEKFWEASLSKIFFLQVGFSGRKSILEISPPPQISNGLPLRVFVFVISKEGPVDYENYV